MKSWSGNFFLVTIFVILLIIQIPKSYASDSEAGELSPEKWQEVNAIVDDIKGESAPQNLKLTLRTGLVQIQTNTPDSIRLGQGNSVMAAGVTMDAAPFGPLGIEASYLYGKNIFSSTNSPNNQSGTITWLDVGPRYTFFLDNARLDNFLAFKILYHQNDSTFQLVNDGSVANPMFMTHYMGIAGAVERSIPISKNLGILASFSLLQILQASSASNLGFNQSGYGFEILGEVYYQIDLNNKAFRVGLSYWQQGNENEFNDSTKPVVTLDSYFQLARSLFANFSILF